eukprot:TRINITY_DN5692_c0_g2_i2.p1 TRINITY_DN5692_c0_g2~~TRINITY_DN5692_c0_g2_i2.p1  ORF type:complete len:548 (+),score=21.44 TRINITY_DN5692_c0_g2_i2:220-1644(+)
MDLQWLAGWMEGDGCIKANIEEGASMTLKHAIKVYFLTNQNNKSLYILCDIAKFIGLRRSQVHFDKSGMMRCSLRSATKIHKLLARMKNLFVGEKWFDCVLAKYISYRLCNRQGSFIENQILTGRYIVQNDNRTKTLHTQKLAKMELIAGKLGCSITQTQTNSMVIYGCHKPNYSLHERFLLGFIEAEACFHVELITNHTLYPIISPKANFSIVQKGSLNRFILEEINKAFGNRCQVQSFENILFRLQTANQDIILENVIPFFQRNIPLSAKYYDFAKFVEICWGVQAGKHKNQGWLENAVKLSFSMNNSSNPVKTGRRVYSLEQYMMYMSLAKDENEVKHKKRNLKVYKLLIFQWIKHWRFLNNGTEKQTEAAKKWFEGLKMKDVQLHLSNDKDCFEDVNKVLNFVAQQVACQETKTKPVDDIYRWFEVFVELKDTQFGQLKCKPYFLVYKQLSLQLDGGILGFKPTPQERNQ